MDSFVVMHLYNMPDGGEPRLRDWFADTLAPQALALRGAVGAQLFRITERQLMPECAQPWRFAAKYDFSSDEPEIDLPALGPLLAGMRDAGMVRDDGAERIHAYRMYHPWKYSANLQPGQPLSHLMFLLANITPGCDEPYHRWYDEVHSVEVSETPGYIGMQRGKLSETQVPPRNYCPGSELIMGALQCDDLAFTIQDFIDRAYGRSPSGVAWSDRPKSASIARTVHMAESIAGPFPPSFVPQSRQDATA